LLFLSVSAYGSSTLRNRFDFDGDGRADIAVFRPSNGVWYIQRSRDGFTAAQFGMNSDRIVPSDYDGDGKTDLSVYRRAIITPGTSGDNTWHILRSSDNVAYARQWGIWAGISLDTPVPADFDGDGKTDLAVLRLRDYIPAPGDYRILQSSEDTAITKEWGFASDKSVPTDYDGDGKDDLAVFRHDPYSGIVSGTGVGIWFILQSSNGAVRVERFGLPTDRLVPADYDGDGKADIAVYRPSNGFWYILGSRDGFRAEQFGALTDKPTPADYDGDGKTDIAVFRPSNGTWYLQQSREGFAAHVFGFPDDIPIPNVYVR
jgi:hypothetical protein